MHAFSLPLRQRSVYAGLSALVLLLGLGSRRFADALPQFIAAYAGDTFWALLVFVGIAFVARSWSTVRVALIAGAFAVAIELSQLYQAPWINAIRQTTFGGLVLGFGFLWSDLICYAVGIALGVLLDLGLQRR